MVERIVTTFNRVLPEALDEGVFVLGPDFGEDVRRQLREICARNGMEAKFGIQDKAEGTAHAVYCAGDNLEGDGIVVFADTVFDMEPGVDLEGADVVAWVKHVDDPSRFGVAVREGDRIVGLVEKPKELISTEALIGIYYVRDLGAMRDAIGRLIEEDVRGHGEYQLTDVFDRMLKAGAVFKSAAVTEWLDCGTIEALLETTKGILAREPGDHLGEIINSSIIPPVYVGPGARVENSVVGPNVSIEAGAQVSGSVVRDSVLFGHCVVENAVLSESLIGEHAEVRPSPSRLNVGDHSTLS